MGNKFIIDIFLNNQHNVITFLYLIHKFYLLMNSQSLRNPFLCFLTLVSAVNDIAYRGIGDAEAPGQLLLGDVLLYHRYFHLFSKWGTWDSCCHI